MVNKRVNSSLMTGSDMDTSRRVTSIIKKYLRYMVRERYDVPGGVSKYCTNPTFYEYGILF